MHQAAVHSDAVSRSGSSANCTHWLISWIESHTLTLSQLYSNLYVCVCAATALRHNIALAAFAPVPCRLHLSPKLAMPARTSMFVDQVARIVALLSYRTAVESAAWRCSDVRTTCICTRGTPIWAVNIFTCVCSKRGSSTSNGLPKRATRFESRGSALDSRISEARAHAPRGVGDSSLSATRRCASPRHCNSQARRDAHLPPRTLLRGL